MGDVQSMSSFLVTSGLVLFDLSTIGRFPPRLLEQSLKVATHDQKLSDIWSFITKRGKGLLQNGKGFTKRASITKQAPAK